MNEWNVTKVIILCWAAIGFVWTMRISIKRIIEIFRKDNSSDK